MSMMLTPDICRVMVVDDEPSVVDIAAGVLELKGFVVHRALSGEEALGATSGALCQFAINSFTGC
jgi:CheY-like chemotaxis protein